MSIYMAYNKRINSSQFCSIHETTPVYVLFCDVCKIIVFENIIPGLHDEFIQKETIVGIANLWDNIQGKMKEKDLLNVINLFMLI